MSTLAFPPRLAPVPDTNRPPRDVPFYCFEHRLSISVHFPEESPETMIWFDGDVPLGSRQFSLLFLLQELLEVLLLLCFCLRLRRVQ